MVHSSGVHNSPFALVPFVTSSLALVLFSCVYVSSFDWLLTLLHIGFLSQSAKQTWVDNLVNNLNHGQNCLQLNSLGIGVHAVFLTRNIQATNYF